MILITLATAVPLWLAPPAAPAQDAAPATAVVAPRQSAAKRVHDELRAAYDAEFARYRAAQSALYESAEWKEAAQNRDRDKQNELRAALPEPDADEHARRALEAAAKFDGARDQALLHALAFELARSGDIARDAILALATKHPTHDALFGATLDLAWRGPVIGEDGFATVVERILAGAAPAPVKANALYARASGLLRTVGKETDLSDEQRAAYEADRARILEIAPDSIAAYRVDGPRFEQERLQIGMVAPNIVGVDLHGEPLTLEQFRGKVVVLDFWGDW